MKNGFYFCLIILLYAGALVPGVLMANTDSPSPCASDPAVSSSGKADIPLLENWKGDYPVSELKRLPEDQQNVQSGYISSAETFASFWEVFKPGESLPVIDFSRQMVVFTRNIDFYNRISILKTELENGVARIIAMETLSAMPIEDKVSMAIAVIEKQGILFVLSGDRKISVK